MKNYIPLLAMLLCVSLFSCNDSDDPKQTPTVPESVTFNFESDAQGWEGGFADYPQNSDAFYEIAFGHAQLPEPLDQGQHALRQTGNNHSDDLFMFAKKKLTNLPANTSINLKFTLEIASNAANASFGVGGSPGSSVYVKAGATATEPKAIKDGNYWRMNIDKNNQANGGKDMALLGDFANGTEENTYALKTLKNTEPFNVTTNDNGEVWLIVGTDSGFESTTTIYYNSIKVEFSQPE
ncbi:hypothetical protein EMN47_19880 [Prolixibacteraceae bacterium JC049]|nr:hypothetical protein [Prolixibacteraceae bacterium JC049]